MIVANQPLNVFIVDDDTLFKYLLTHTINGIYPSYLIETFSSVEEILQAEAITPSIILLDHFLSGKNGIDSIPLLQLKFPNTHIMVISAQKDEALTQQVLSTSNCSFLSKQELSISNFTKKMKTLI